MNIRCRFECADHICRRWAMRGSNFCYNHQPKPDRADQGEFLHPLARLATPEDVFDVVRETLNAARLGRIPVGQAYAVGFLAQTLLKIREQLGFEHRNDAIYRQLIPTIADEESAEDTEAAVTPFLPVEPAEELTLELPNAQAQPPAEPPALPPSEAPPPQVAGFDRFLAEFNHHLAATASAKASHRATPQPVVADGQLEPERAVEPFESAKSA